MDPLVAQTGTGPVHFLNIEYIFYLIYTSTHGVGTGAVSGSGGFNASAFFSALTPVWIWFTVIAYTLSAVAIGVLVFTTKKIHRALASDAPKYATFTNEETAETEVEHHRWKHVRELIESPSQNDWRQAIIEADIILDDMLNRLGYVGESIGDKLKRANPAHFRTLQEAWEAHKVRNDIAHQGSEFRLSDQLAYRTILHYESVFKEHNEI